MILLEMVLRSSILFFNVSVRRVAQGGIFVIVSTYSWILPRCSCLRYLVIPRAFCLVFFPLFAIRFGILSVGFALNDRVIALVIFFLVCVPPPPRMKTRNKEGKGMGEGGEVEDGGAEEEEEEPHPEEEEEEEEEEEDDEKEEGEGENGLVKQEERQEQGEEEEEESSARGGGVVLADTLPVVSEQEARMALLNLVAEHCCWGKAAARNMNITKIASTSAFHVTICHYALRYILNI